MEVIKMLEWLCNLCGWTILVEGGLFIIYLIKWTVDEFKAIDQLGKEEE
jgi:hypothetical protein